MIVLWRVNLNLPSDGWPLLRSSAEVIWWVTEEKFRM